MTTPNTSRSNKIVLNSVSHEKALLARIREFQKSEVPNKRCADCSELGPTYICMTYGTFICATCAGIHREFNHKVKGVSVSQWKDEDVDFIVSHGNAKCADIYLKTYQNEISPPDPNQIDRLRNWIKSKYIDKRWVFKEDSSKPKKDIIKETQKGTKKKSTTHTTSKREIYLDESNDDDLFNPSTSFSPFDPPVSPLSQPPSLSPHTSNSPPHSNRHGRGALSDVSQGQAAQRHNKHSKKSSSKQGVESGDLLGLNDDFKKVQTSPAFDTFDPFNISSLPTSAPQTPTAQTSTPPQSIYPFRPYPSPLAFQIAPPSSHIPTASPFPNPSFLPPSQGLTHPPPSHPQPTPPYQLSSAGNGGVGDITNHSFQSAAPLLNFSGPPPLQQTAFTPPYPLPPFSSFTPSLAPPSHIIPQEVHHGIPHEGDRDIGDRRCGADTSTMSERLSNQSQGLAKSLVTTLAQHQRFQGDPFAEISLVTKEGGKINSEILSPGMCLRPDAQSVDIGGLGGGKIKITPQPLLDCLSHVDQESHQTAFLEKQITAIKDKLQEPPPPPLLPVLGHAATSKDVSREGPWDSSGSNGSSQPNKFGPFGMKGSSFGSKEQNMAEFQPISFPSLKSFNNSIDSTFSTSSQDWANPKGNELKNSFGVDNFNDKTDYQWADFGTVPPFAHEFSSPTALAKSSSTLNLF